MPAIEWPPRVATDTFTLPNSGVTVTMKRLADGSDKHEAFQAVLGEGFNRQHSYARFLKYMAALLVVSWDAVSVDDKGNQVPIPISPQTISAVVTDEKDYDQLLSEAGKRTVLREDEKPEEERNFTPPSTPSSAEESLPTPESSLDSST